MKMNKYEIRNLEEKLIRIRDQVKMSMWDRDAIAEAVNLITHNEDALTEE